MALRKSISETKGCITFSHKELKVIVLAHYFKISLYFIVEKSITICGRNG